MDLLEILGASVQLASEGIYCQQDRDRKRLVINWQVIGSLFLVGGFVRVIESSLILWPCHWDIV